MNFCIRTISKIGFLLVIFGFFMPWGSFSGFAALLGRVNGLELASLLMKYDNDLLGMLIYFWFASALIGIVIGILLMMKKEVPIIVDVAIMFICFFGSLFFLLETYQKPQVVIHSGAQLVFVGAAFAYIVQFISCIKEMDKLY